MGTKEDIKNIIKWTPIGIPLQFEEGGIFNPSSPDRQVAELDPGTKGLIESSVNDALAPTADYQREAQRGLAESFMAPQQTEDQFKAQEESGLGMSPEFGSALREKYAQQAQEQLSSLKSQADLQAKLLKGADLRRGINLSIAQKNVQMQNLMALSQARLQQEATRASILSSVMYSGGYMVGYGKQAGWFDQQNQQSMGPQLSQPGTGSVVNDFYGFGSGPSKTPYTDSLYNTSPQYPMGFEPSY